MSALSINPPYPVFPDIDGQPLEDGYIWIGTAGMNPISNPIVVYWDAALTIPAPQPIRTIGGFPARAGSPARLYAGSDYSIQVQNKNGSVTYSAPNQTEILSSDLVTFIQAGTGAVQRTVQSKLREYVSVKDFGAVGDGVTDDALSFLYAIRSGKSVYIPKGTYLMNGAGVGDFMLYIGSNGNIPLLQNNLNGLEVFGDGNESIIKLGNNVGRNKLLFGAGVGDSLANMIFRDFAIDLNGQNNLQSAYTDPLRYNSAFYLFCPCNNMTFENLYITNLSGSQGVRIGNDSGNYGANIKVLNCRVNNFGIGIPNNFQQDISVFYIQADGILIDGCWFQNSNFTFDLSRGQTALELHGQNSTIVTNCRFSYTQMPVLLVSSYQAISNVLVDNNVFIETAYLTALDPAALDQKRITVSNNIYQSTKMSGSGIIPLGASGETAKVREEISIVGNTVNCFGNANQRVNLVYCEDNYLRSIVIQENIVSGLPGNLMYFAGAVQNTGFCDIVIKNNRLDSLGNVGGGTFPTVPSFVYVVPTSNTINTLTIDGNQLFNTAGKNYSSLGLFAVGGNINYLTIENNEVSSVSAAYPVTTQASLVSLIRLIQAGYYMPVNYRTGPVVVAGGGGVVNLYSFSGGAGWGDNDNALLTAQLWIGVGGTTNNTIQFLNIGWSSSGGNVTTDSNFGTYAADVSVSFSGTVLRITNNNVSALALYWNVQGLSTKPIAWAV